MASSWPTRPARCATPACTASPSASTRCIASRFERLTRFDEHAAVLAGIDAANRAGFGSLKIDTVVMRGTNDDELIDLLEYGRSVGAEVRFIEYMDVGGATRWSRDAVVSQDEMLRTIEAHYGPVSALAGRARRQPTASPARRHDVRHHRVDHAPVLPGLRSQPPDRRWRLADVPLRDRRHRFAAAAARRRHAARSSSSLIRTVWSQRADRGAEERLLVGSRTPLIPLAALKKDAHLEMHTRGG